MMKKTSFIGVLCLPLRSHYGTGDQWRNNSRKNEEMELKQKQHPVVDVTGDGSKSDAVKSNIA